MKIEYVFCKNKKIGSKLIAWGSSLFPNDITNLKQVPSHVGILIDNTFVIEAVIPSGIRIIPYKKWQDINIQLYKIPSKNQAENLNDLLFEIWGKKYDFLGILYFGYEMLKHKLFKTQLPHKNKWERENYFFCTEFAARLEGYNYSMTTPAKMCNDLLESVK